MKNKRFYHRKKLTMYVVIQDNILIQENGEWVEAVRYRPDNENSCLEFVRSKKEFNIKFIAYYKKK